MIINDRMSKIRIITIIVVSIVASLSILMIYESVLNNVSDESGTNSDMIMSVSPKKEDEYAFQHIELNEGYSPPGSSYSTLPVFRIVEPVMNSSIAKSMLEDHNYLSVKSEIDEGANWVKIQFPDNRTVASFDGRLTYYQDDDDASPVALEEIDTDHSLLNYTQAYQLALSYLKEHNLYNSSWKTIKKSSVRTMNLSTNEVCIDFYIFKRVPVLDGRPLIDSNAPSVSVWVNPQGTVLRCSFLQREIIPIEDDIKFHWTDPADVLVEFDKNITDFLSTLITSNTTIYINKLEIGYFVDDNNIVVPSWILYVSEDKEIGETMVFFNKYLEGIS